MGALVRHSGGPQVVRAYLRVCDLAHTLVEIDPQYPSISPTAREELQEARAQLMAEAPE